MARLSHLSLAYDVTLHHLHMISYISRICIAWLAQLEERRSADRVQTPAGPTLRVFK